MIDLNKHKYFLLQILKEIYTDIELANYLGFKGGTALMFLYNLPRFSVDLDFNLLNADAKDLVYEKIKAIVLKHGTIHDEAKKHFGSIIVLSYGKGERKLKIEISNRVFEDHYELKDFLGIQLKVMVLQDLFAHKLCALLDRNELTNRDVFDIHFLLTKRTAINKQIVESRMKMPLSDYLQQCIDSIEKLSDKGMLYGLGELTDKETKTFVRNQLRTETIELLKIFQAFPIIT